MEATGIRSFVFTVITILVILRTSTEGLVEIRQNQDFSRIELKQEDEDVTTERPTNGHLIGTLAGVISSILRAGPNGTSPIKLNFTDFQNRIGRLPLLPKLPFPIFPGGIFSKTNQNSTISKHFSET